MSRHAAISILLATAVVGADNPWFVDVAPDSGLAFTHRTGATGRYYMPEITGSGAALLDYDGDGDLDVYLVQAYPLDGEPGPGAANRLFRNDLDDAGTLRFVDVTDAAGVGDRGYGQGCATADYDGDGDVDLYVTNFGVNVLYRNDGDGTFTDVSDALPPETRWSTSASFLDYDRDGRLDLFVTNYVNLSVVENRACFGSGGRRDYCGPESFDPVPDRLYHNAGDGTFTDATRSAGVDQAFGSGLGTVAADFDGDGWTDLYVANDGRANQLWMNRRDGTFANTALFAGAAYNADGQAEAGMGVTAADFDGDGDTDVFLAHLLGETNTLLVNEGDGFFGDGTDRSTLGTMSRTDTGFGVRWTDLDNDGWLDLFVANGAVKIEDTQAGEPYPYGNPNLVARNGGPPDFRFEDVSDRAGAVVRLVETSRGAAFGDVDNDGDVDILVMTSNGPARLLRNEIGSRHAWLRLRLVDRGGNPRAIGATVELSGDGPAHRERVRTDGSYLSASDDRVHFGLGADERPRDVVVSWPDGRRERFADLAPRREHRLVRGDGEALP